ncbi:MAG TPA: hypothetical protein DIU00_06500 [Phycisphaerales bacterium]|nr:hypothetical protein [Phycisphaerales bacterium]
MVKIDKQLFLSILFCPTYGWLQRTETSRKTLSVADQLRIDEGTEFHQRARGLFPSGVMVPGPTEAAVQTTQELLSDPETTVIFEATFVYHKYVAKADILIRNDNNSSSWKIIEVKSNVNDDNELVDDLAYTTFVAHAAGVSLQHAIAKCPALNIENLFSLLLDVNTPSIRILEKFGFVKWGYMPEVAEFDGRTCGHLIYGRKV